MATKVTETTAKRAARNVRAQEAAETIVRLRDEEGMKWPAIAKQLGLQVGRTIHTYEDAKLPPKQRVKWKTEDELAAAVVRLRDDEKLSWMRIAIRCSITNARAVAVYEASGKVARGTSIGRGGRRLAGKAPTATATRATKVAPKAPAKGAPARRQREGQDAAKAAKETTVATPKARAAKATPANTTGSMASVPADELKAFKAQHDKMSVEQLTAAQKEHAARSPKWRVIKNILAERARA